MPDWKQREEYERRELPPEIDPEDSGDPLPFDLSRFGRLGEESRQCLRRRLGEEG
ncbi:MAG: hypothetical protein IJ240_07240 [Clostridia bacterium]|nr:hypothetical protein [Clostridia bacterium]